MERDHVYLSHMRDAIAKIERYVAGTDYETFTGNDMMIGAVILPQLKALIQRILAEQAQTKPPTEQ